MVPCKAHRTAVGPHGGTVGFVELMATSAPTPPRVLLACPVGDAVGGAEQVMLAIARELPRHGFEPVLATMRPGRLAGAARAQGTAAHAFPADHRYRDLAAVWRASAWLAGLARSTGATLIHASHTAHVYAAVAARRTGRPEVWHLHDPPTPGDAVQAISRRLRPAHAVFITRAVAAGYPDLCRGPHTVIAPSCIEPDFFRPRPADPDVRRRLGLPEDGPLLLTVARLQDQKGHADLIDAAAVVLRDRPDATFAVVGTASTAEQQAYRAGLLARCDRLGLNGRVVFVGPVDHDRLAPLYRSATALVHPAWSEGYGLVLLEAMGLGLPVIAAAASGPAEVVRDGDNGLLVPVRDPPALAAAVARVLADADLRRQLSAGGLESAGQLTLNSMMESTADVYRRTLAGRDDR